MRKRCGHCFPRIIPPSLDEIEARPIRVRERERMSTMRTRQSLLNLYGDACGVACGATMAIGASLSFAAARAGIVAGIRAEDLVLLRFLIAGIIFLPFVIRWGPRSLAGIGWARGLILLALGGPVFALLQLGGYSYAPLAHGALIMPPTVTILSTALAAVTLNEQLTPAHLSGAISVILGILLLGVEGLSHASADRAWIGDLMFIASAVMWAGFTVLLRHWRLEAARAVGVVSVLSLIVMLPGYAVSRHLLPLLAVPPVALLTQALVQGGLQGVVGITAYGHAIGVLGVSRAVLFPAAVPALSVLIGIPIVGEWPSLIQIWGLILVTFGLLVAIGALRLTGRRKPTLC
jgi:drug/metabolite transporter (DMT)-like permease